MLRIALIILVMASLAACESNDARRATERGEPTSERAGDMGQPTDAAPASAARSDTILVYTHQVKPGREVDYERWVREVWMAAVRKAGEKVPEVRVATERQRLFAHTDKWRDSSSRYVWLFEPVPPFTERMEKWSFPDSFLVAGGFSPEQAASHTKALREMVTAMEGGEVIRKF